MKLNLDIPTIALLTILTDGMIAGLQLAALNIRELAHEEIADFIIDLSGEHRCIIDYLISKVMAGLPKDISSFLCNTAVLDCFCASLCNAVTGKKDSEEILRFLDFNNFLLVPCDNQHSWYRHHHLIANFLSKKLSREKRQSINQKAADWFKTNGHMEDPVTQTITAATYKKAEHYLDSPDDSAMLSTDGLYVSLSKRELELLRLASTGMSNEEIALKTNISLNTVKWHIRNVLQKFEVNSRIKAIVKAKKLNLI